MANNVVQSCSETSDRMRNYSYALFKLMTIDTIDDNLLQIPKRSIYEYFSYIKV